MVTEKSNISGKISSFADTEISEKSHAVHATNKHFQFPFKSETKGKYYLIVIRYDLKFAQNQIREPHKQARPRERRARTTFIFTSSRPFQSTLTLLLPPLRYSQLRNQISSRNPFRMLHEHKRTPFFCSPFLLSLLSVKKTVKAAAIKTTKRGTHVKRYVNYPITGV